MSRRRSERRSADIRMFVDACKSEGIDVTMQPAHMHGGTFIQIGDKWEDVEFEGENSSIQPIDLSSIKPVTFTIQPMTPEQKENFRAFWRVLKP